MDDVDRRLLTALSEVVRAPDGELAIRLGIEVEDVASRARRLATRGHLIRAVSGNYPHLQNCASLRRDLLPTVQRLVRDYPDPPRLTDRLLNRTVVTCLRNRGYEVEYRRRPAITANPGSRLVVEAERRKDEERALRSKQKIRYFFGVLEELAWAQLVDPAVALAALLDGCGLEDLAIYWYQWARRAGDPEASYLAIMRESRASWDPPVPPHMTANDSHGDLGAKVMDLPPSPLTNALPFEGSELRLQELYNVLDLLLPVLLPDDDPQSEVSIWDEILQLAEQSEINTQLLDSLERQFLQIALRIAETPGADTGGLTYSEAERLDSTMRELASTAGVAAGERLRDDVATLSELLRGALVGSDRLGQWVVIDPASRVGIRVIDAEEDGNPLVHSSRIPIQVLGLTVAPGIGAPLKPWELPPGTFEWPAPIDWLARRGRWRSLLFAIAVSANVASAATWAAESLDTRPAISSVAPAAASAIAHSNVESVSAMPIALQETAPALWLVGTAASALEFLSGRRATELEKERAKSTSKPTSRRRRRSAAEKAAAVEECLRGTDKVTCAAGMEVTVRTLSTWRQQYRSGATAAVSARLHNLPVKGRPSLPAVIKAIEAHLQGLSAADAARSVSLDRQQFAILAKDFKEGGRAAMTSLAR